MDLSPLENSLWLINTYSRKWFGFRLLKQVCIFKTSWNRNHIGFRGVLIHSVHDLIEVCFNEEQRNCVEQKFNITNNIYCRFTIPTLYIFSPQFHWRHCDGDNKKIQHKKFYSIIRAPKLAKMPDFCCIFFDPCSLQYHVDGDVSDNLFQGYYTDMRSQNL